MYNYKSNGLACFQKDLNFKNPDKSHKEHKTRIVL